MTDKLLTHVVQKRFLDDSAHREIGECVNALGWRTAHKMEGQRYITPLPDHAEPVPSEDGRWWVDMDCMQRAGAAPLGSQGAAAPMAAPEVKEAPQAAPVATEPAAGDQAATEVAAPPAPDTTAPVEYPLYIRDRRGYELSDGRFVRGNKEVAAAAEAALHHV